VDKTFCRGEIMSQRIRVLIVDDHAMVRKGLAAFLKAFPDLELIGEAASGEEAVTLCPEILPDVVLMDLMMPGMGGIKATAEIRKQCPTVQVIALTSSKEHEMVQDVLRAGAIGYLMKDISAEELANAIRSANSGEPALSLEATQALIEAATHSSPSYAIEQDLTERETEVLKLMVEGLSNPEIAKRLSVSRSTVKTHVSNVLSKLGVSSRVEAVTTAIQRKLIL
jgi:two-component system, NarL family, response regulator LiaR